MTLTLESVRDDFIMAAGELTEVAQSIAGLARFGATYVGNRLRDYPDASFIIGAGPPEAATIRTDMKMADMIPAYEHHRGVIYEWAHARLIHEWHLTLQAWYAILLTEHLKGEVNRPSLKPIQIRFNPHADELLDGVVEEATAQFDWLTSHERLSLIAGALGVDLPADLSPEIKKHVAVRNIFQHNKGTVRAGDLKDLGLAGDRGIHLLDNALKKREFVEGERLEITHWEFCKAVTDLQTAARLLVA